MTRSGKAIDLSLIRKRASFGFNEATFDIATKGGTNLRSFYKTPMRTW
jgi:hypothetical protein